MNKEVSLVMDMTKEELIEMERAKKTPLQKLFDFIISILPFISGAIAILEYLLVPNIRENKNPMTYIYCILFFISLYALFWLHSIFQLQRGKNKYFSKLRYKAPLYSAIFLLLTIYDYLTLKTGKLQYPFLPWINDIINIMITDKDLLLQSAISTLILLFYGYFLGVIAGLITGVLCGYSKKLRYWVEPIIKILGPIPTATWIPLVMVLATTLFKGSVFIIALGVWFSVTVATMTGISNIEKSYFDAAKTLGANNKQLVFRVAIPYAVPSIIQGMIQGMSSACTALMIAEMLGVESGLGWYIIWAKSWAMYNKMFAAIIIICIIFITVTKLLNIIKKKVLRWQEGMVI